MKVLCAWGGEGGERKVGWGVHKTVAAKGVSRKREKEVPRRG